MDARTQDGGEDEDEATVHVTIGWLWLFASTWSLCTDRALPVSGGALLLLVSTIVETLPR
jgi:hypothetical protein